MLNAVLLDDEDATSAIASSPIDCHREDQIEAQFLTEIWHSLPFKTDSETNQISQISHLW